MKLFGCAGKFIHFIPQRSSGWLLRPVSVTAVSGTYFFVPFVTWLEDRSLVYLGFSHQVRSVCRGWNPSSDYWTLEQHIFNLAADPTLTERTSLKSDVP